ncbi:hypothetical protein DLREEDagrD3_15040 [Denitratisoma sp. agr-D3]
MQILFVVAKQRPRREFAPAGDLLSCFCKKVGKEAAPTTPPLTGFPPSEPPERPVLQTSGYAASDSKPGLPRSGGSPLGGAERDGNSIPIDHLTPLLKPLPMENPDNRRL